MPEDEGKYECQVSTEPKLSHFVRLNVRGESLSRFAPPFLLFPAGRKRLPTSTYFMLASSSSPNNDQSFAIKTSGRPISVFPITLGSFSSHNFLCDHGRNKTDVKRPGSTPSWSEMKSGLGFQQENISDTVHTRH